MVLILSSFSTNMISQDFFISLLKLFGLTPLVKNSSGHFHVSRTLQNYSMCLTVLVGFLQFYAIKIYDQFTYYEYFFRIVSFFCLSGIMFSAFFCILTFYVTRHRFKDILNELTDIRQSIMGMSKESPANRYYLIHVITFFISVANSSIYLLLKCYTSNHKFCISMNTLVCTFVATYIVLTDLCFSFLVINVQHLLKILNNVFIKNYYLENTECKTYIIRLINCFHQRISNSSKNINDHFSLTNLINMTYSTILMISGPFFYLIITPITYSGIYTSFFWAFYIIIKVVNVLWACSVAENEVIYIKHLVLYKSIAVFSFNLI